MKTHSSKTSGAVIRLVQPQIGAEITGIDLACAPQASEINQLRAALLEHKVLFFRDQKIAREQHIALARQFGNLEENDFSHVAGFPAISPIRGEDGVASDWHTDGSYCAKPTSIVILRAVEVPEIGGDTLWCDAQAAYEGLDDALKSRISTLYAVHDVAALSRFSSPIDANHEERMIYFKEARNRHPMIAHPIVRRHPETGKKILYVNSTWTVQILGMGIEEGNDLLKRLYREFFRPEYQVRFRWEKDSIAVWDNRATQHYAVPNFMGRRYLERVAVQGDQVIS